MLQLARGLTMQLAGRKASMPSCVPLCSRLAVRRSLANIWLRGNLQKCPVLRRCTVN
jgi:hypothetical protein